MLSPNFQTFNEPKNQFQGIGSASPGSPAGQYDNPMCRTGPPHHTDWRNRLPGIDSWAPQKVEKFALWFQIQNWFWESSVSELS